MSNKTLNKIRSILLNKENGLYDSDEAIELIKGVLYKNNKLPKHL